MGVPRHSENKVGFIIDFIRRERVKQGLSQLELADLAGVSTVTLSHYETGARPAVAVKIVERLLDVLDYELDIHLKEKEIQK